MITAVDTSILIDVFGADARFGTVSANALRSADTLAGVIWKKYRSAGGKRDRVIADFLIGAHALRQCDQLLTRDRGYYKKHFTGLAVVDAAAYVAHGALPTVPTW